MMLMNKTLRLALCALLVLSSGLALACDYPARPFLPDGNEASKEDMLAAKTAVQDFLAAVDEYLRCVEADEHSAFAAIPADQRDESVRQERELALTRKFDAANEEKVLVGEQFNKQVRAYNAKRQQNTEDNQE
jgi:hypothetical protein